MSDNALVPFTAEDVKTGQKSVWDFFALVPHGNSDEQMRSFVMDHCTNSRNFRQIVIELKADCKRLQYEYFNRRKLSADMKKKEGEIQQFRAKLKAGTKFYVIPLTGSERTILEAEIEHREAEIDEFLQGIKSADLLIEDAQRRIEIMLEGLKKTGIFTREEFEEQEKIYWQTRLLNDARIEAIADGRIEKGTLKSLEQVGYDAAKIAYETRKITGENIKRLEAGDNNLVKIQPTRTEKQLSGA